MLVLFQNTSTAEALHVSGGRGGRGDRGAKNVPLPVPFNPGSRPVFVGSCLFAFFRLQNIAQCCIIFPFSPASCHPGNPASCPLFSRHPYTSCPLFPRAPAACPPQLVTTLIQCKWHALLRPLVPLKLEQFKSSLSDCDHFCGLPTVFLCFYVLISDHSVST